MTIQFKKCKNLLAMAALSVATLASTAQAAIDGISGTATATGRVFNLTVKDTVIYTPDGDTMTIWGYGEVAGNIQYPGPTLIVNQGEQVTVTLTNRLGPDAVTPPPMPVSIIFPGQEGVTATGGSAGTITQESTGYATTDITQQVTYTFTANNPGTYLYQSGTRPGLQVEMGLVGAMIVRPTSFSPGAAGNRIAYEHPDTAYDHEYLFLLTEMDPKIHTAVEFGLINQINNIVTKPVFWFINGRNGPDTMGPSTVQLASRVPPEPPVQTFQPYTAIAQMHPGERTLIRVIGAGRDLHPFHTHGNNFHVIARDGRILQSTPGAGPDLQESDYTLKVEPGTTYDAIFQWTGANLGWDIYGHAPGDPLAPNEYAPDHGKPIPVTLPEQLDLAFGAFYGGSPFLGELGPLPPPDGGFSIAGGLYHIWHSHTEKELANNDIFPGGMMTMMVVEPSSVVLPYSPF